MKNSVNLLMVLLTTLFLSACAPRISIREDPLTAREVKSCNIAELVSSAEQGNTEDQLRLSLCYARGAGRNVDFDASNLWLQKALDQNSLSAQAEYSKRLVYGTRGVKKDAGKARDYFAKALVQWNDLKHRKTGEEMSHMLVAMVARGALEESEGNKAEGTTYYCLAFSVDPLFNPALRHLQQQGKRPSDCNK